MNLEIVIGSRNKLAINLEKFTGKEKERFKGTTNLSKSSDPVFFHQDSLQ